MNAERGSMSSKWSYTKEAQKEGWVLSERDDGFWEIQRYDDDPTERFKTDAAAYLFVKKQADGGSAIHTIALSFDGTFLNKERGV